MDVKKRNQKWQCRAKTPTGEYRYKSFHTKKDALAWGKKVETESHSVSPVCNITVKQLLERYENEVARMKRGYEQEVYKIRVLKRASFASLKLDKITTQHIEQHKRERKVKMATVFRELAILANAFTIAQRDWHLPIKRNPVTGVSFPGAFVRRRRRLKQWEYDLLIESATDDLRDLINLALETAMRRGEILQICRNDVDFDQRRLTIPKSKTMGDTPQEIHLSKRAVEILRLRLHNKKGNAKAFPDWTSNAARLQWQRLKNKLGLKDLRFHDLRGESLSRYAEKGLKQHELQMISRHTNMQTLSIYLRGDMDTVLDKIDA